jgi:hypothetical protein
LNIKKNAKKWLMITIILCALSIETVSAAKFHSNQQVHSNGEPSMVNTVNIEQSDISLTPASLKDTKVIASEPELHITIRGKAKSDGTYENMSIHTPTFNRVLDGIQVINPAYAPQIHSADLDGDGQPEVIVILTNGYGTGIDRTEVRVYRQNGTAIAVEDAQEAWHKHFQAQVQGQQIELQLNQQKMTLPTSILQDATISGDHAVEVGSVQQYNIVDGQLVVAGSVQVGMMDILGELTTVYQYKQGILQALSSSLELDEPYRSAIQTK